MIQSILLLEDDEDDREMFTEALKTICARVNFVSVSNGLEALKYLDSALILPDVIFLDINMPKMNGFEFLKELNKIELYQKVPIVMLSTSAIGSHPHRRDFSHVPFYTKPTNFKKLCDVINEVIVKLESFTNEEQRR